MKNSVSITTEIHELYKVYLGLNCCHYVPFVLLGLQPEKWFFFLFLSAGVSYQWFKNAATNIFVFPGNPNMFVSYGGSLYVTEVQPTDGPKYYFCTVTLIGTDTARLAKANTLARSNLGILLLLSDDSSKLSFIIIFIVNVRI